MQHRFLNAGRMVALITLIVLGTFVELRGGPVYCASNFHRYFEALGVPEAGVGPVQRFFVSLLLANSRPASQVGTHPGDNLAKGKTNPSSAPLRPF